MINQYEIVKRTAFCFSALLLFFGVQISTANAAEFDVKITQSAEGRDFFTFRMDGPIVEGDSEKLKLVLEQATDDATSVFQSNVLILNSLGGGLDASIALANTVRELGLGTLVDEGGKCLSGCAIVFMSGAWLEGDGYTETFRVLHHKGVLGFHAPFAFDKTDNIDPEVAKLLLKDAERGGTIAASKLVKLSVNNILPTSLVEELLQYEADSFLYIDTIDRAGRWKIPIKDAGAYLLASDVVQQHDRNQLVRHCDNLDHWQNDISIEKRDSILDYEPTGLHFGGMEFSCEYTQEKNKFGYTINGKHGTVLHWQTLPANTKLSALTKEQVTGRIIRPDAFANPPAEQVNGECKNGFRWIGGWAGAYYSESTAYAQYSSCDTTLTHAPIVLECKHGSGNIETRIALKSFGHDGKGDLRVESQIDDGYELGSGGIVTEERGLIEFVNTLSRDYFTFEHMMSGSKMWISVNGVKMSIHLSGTRKAITAMMDACI